MPLSMNLKIIPTGRASWRLLLASFLFYAAPTNEAQETKGGPTEAETLRWISSNLDKFVSHTQARDQDQTYHDNEGCDKISVDGDVITLVTEFEYIVKPNGKPADIVLNSKISYSAKLSELEIPVKVSRIESRLLIQSNIPWSGYPRWVLTLRTQSQSEKIHYSSQDLQSSAKGEPGDCRELEIPIAIDDEDSAHRLAKALGHLIELHGGKSDDLFK
jgi:hypothetical protein